MPIYLLFSFLAAFLFSLQYLFEKLTAKYAIKTRTGLLFYVYFAFMPFALLVPLFVNITWPSQAWGPIWRSSFCYFVGNFLFFTAIFKTDVSVFAPILQLQTPFVAILAFLFLKERFSVTSYIWVGLMIMGAVSVAYEEKIRFQAFFHRAVLLIVGSTFFYALSDLYAGFALRDINPWNFIFWSTFVNMVWVLPFILFDAPSLRISFRQFCPMLLVSFFGAAGYTSLLKAYQYNLTLSNAFALLASPIVLVITVLISRFKPKLLERHTAKVYFIRAIGVALILFGALQISLRGQ